MTSHQFLGKSWLHYDVTFPKDAAASSLVYWSHMNLDLYNFHTRTTLLQTSPSFHVPSLSLRMLASSSNICQSWNYGICRWPFGHCRYRHCCKKCEGAHPVSTLPYRPHSPIVSTRSQVPCHGVNASGISLVARSF